MTLQIQPPAHRELLPAIKYFSKTLLSAVVILILAGLLAYALRSQILAAVGGFLVIDEPRQPADVIFLLNGAVETRPFLAAKLYSEGFAPRIVVPKQEESLVTEMGLLPNGTDVAVDILKHLGVPEDKITVVVIEGGVTSTRDEAVVLRHYISTNKVERVIVVTSDYHTRRAKWIFAKVLDGSGITLTVSAATDRRFNHTNWWRHERGLINFTNEYIKFAYYLAVY
jgi:uncharacterized SAM-binding protein YcdF (DUF218 family)